MSDQHIVHDATPVEQNSTSLYGGESSTTIPSQPSRGRQILRFLRHFGEMMLTMLLGMAAFDVISGVLPVTLSPEISTLGMAGAMTVPMVAWMAIRKHAWWLNVEMAGAMIVPTLLLIAASTLGLLPRTSLMMGTHLLMVPAMLAVMLYRWRDYTCH